MSTTRKAKRRRLNLLNKLGRPEYFGYQQFILDQELNDHAQDNNPEGTESEEVEAEGDQHQPEESEAAVIKAKRFEGGKSPEVNRRKGRKKRSYISRTRSADVSRRGRTNGRAS